MTSSQIMFTVLIPLVVWRLYSRYRKLVGKQHIHPTKLWGSVIVFPLIVILFGVRSIGHIPALLCLIAGGLAGFGLSFVGLRLTKFEYVNSVLSYTPNSYLGSALLLLLAGRVGYRFFQLADATGQQGQAAMQSMASPFTTLIIGVLACYYASYSAGILRRQHKLQRSERPVDNGAGGAV